MSGETINIGNGDGLTFGFKKLLVEKMNKGEIKSMDLDNVALSKWNKVISAFVDINNTRKQNGKETIYSGKDGWTKEDPKGHMIVHVGQIKLEDNEMKMLYDAFGVELTTATVVDLANGQQQGNVAPQEQEQGNEVVQTQQQGDKVVQTQQQGNEVVQTQQQGNEVVQTQQQGSGPNSEGYSRPTVIRPETRTSVSFDREAFDERVKDAKISAEIIKAQTDAIKKGVDLREEATEVDLEGLNKYSKEGCPECWGNVVDTYFKGTHNVYTQQVPGGEYDSNDQSIKDRVLAGEPNNEKSLQEELKENNLETLISENADIDINQITVNGQSISNIKNLTLENSNEDIGKTAEELAAAVLKIENGIAKVDENLTASRTNLDIENQRVKDQVELVNVHKNNIKTYLDDVDREFISEYNRDKVTIDAMSGDNYEAYGKYGMAREAADKQLLARANMKIVKSKDGDGYVWDLNGITDETVRKNTQEALNRLMTAYSGIQEEINAIGKASIEIEKSRQGVVEAMQNVVKLEIVKQQLSNLKVDLDSKATRLKEIYQNLNNIDDFVKTAGVKADKMYMEETENANKAKAKADRKRAKQKRHADNSRGEIEKDKQRSQNDGSDDTEINNKSRKSTKKGTKMSPKVEKAIEEENETRNTVKKHDRAVYDRDEALEQYEPHAVEPVSEVVASSEPRTIATVDEVPEGLRSVCSSLITQFRSYNVSLTLDGDKIKVINNVNNQVVYTATAATSGNAVRVLSPTTLGLQLKTDN